MKRLGIGTYNVPTRRRRVLFAILLGIMTIIGGLFYSATNAMAADTVSLVVKLIDGLSPTEQTAVIARNGGVETSAIPALRLHVVTVQTADQSLVQLNYQADAQVVSVEVNKTRKAEAIPTDANYGVQWALSKIGWESFFGTVAPTSKATLALLDTGVDAAHPDLAGNVIPGTSVLDGTNGLSDPSGHGTWLAGIAAAATDNGTGIAGVAFGGVQVMPVSVLNAGGTGQDSDIIAGIVWAVDHGADVILMGFSNPDFSQNLQDAIDYAWLKGAVLVAATGNNGVVTPTFPAGDRGVIGVSATDQNDLLAPASNYGQDTFLAAPGADIYTTGLNGGYSFISGTSASSAFVAGAAAFMKAVDPSLSNGVIVGRLARSADAIGTAGDPNNPAMFGNGRLNMAKALADTGIDPVQPAGAPGGGGPFVGPYVAAAQPARVEFATDGLPAGYTMTITATYTNPGGGSKNFSGTLTSGVTLSGPNTEPETNVDYAGFVASATISGVVYALDSTTPASPFKSGTSGYTTLVKAKYVQACTAPSVSTQPSDQTKTVAESVTFSVTAAGTAPLSYQWRKNRTNISGATNSSYTISSLLVSDANIYDVVVTNTCGSATSGAATLKVNKAISIVSVWPAASGITYGQALSDSTLTGGSASVSGSFTFETPSTKPDAGTYSASVTFTPTDAANYNPASGYVDVAVAKADATCTVSGYTDVYDGAAHGAAGSCTGVGGSSDVLSGLNLGSSFTNVPGGVANWAFSNGNYNDQSGSVAITINPKPTTVGITGGPFTYDGNQHAATVATTPEGVSVSVNYSSSSPVYDSATSPTNAGTYIATVAIIDPNFVLSGSGTGSITINKADATCTISGYTGDYDAAAHGASGSCIGIGGISDVLSGLNLGSSFTNVPGGSANWAFSNGNYKDQSGSVAITINPKPTTVGITGGPFTYDGNHHAATVATTPEGVSVSVNYSSSSPVYDSATPPTNAGTYTATVAITDPNYVLSGSGTGSITINKATPTVNVVGGTFIYDGNSHPATATATGVGEATVSGSFTFTYTPGGSSAPMNAAATAYGISASFISSDPNYADASGTGSITINKATSITAVTVEGGTNFSYDGNAHPAIVSVTGVGGLNLTPVPVYSCGHEPKDVADTGCTASYTFVGDTNHVGSTDSKAYTIGKAISTTMVTVNNATYNGSSHGGNAAVSGAGNLNQSLTLFYVGRNGTVYSSSTTAPTNAGDYMATASFGGDDNHVGSTDSKNFTITKANAICTVTGYSVIYEGNAHTATGSCTGVNGESLNGLNLDSTTHTNVGSYTDNWTFSNANYSDKNSTVTDTIQAWTLRGFYQPVDMTTNGVLVWNTVKNGSTVPLKFEVFAGSTELTDVSKIKSVNYLQVFCTNDAIENAIEEVITTTGGTILRYDTTGGQFIDNWKTPNKSGNCYRVTMTTQDGSSLMALFKLK